MIPKMILDNNIKFKIPQKIQNIISNEKYHINSIGLSDSTVLCFEKYVLKIERECETSDNEHAMLKWLQGRLPVPKIIASEKEEGINYLLMSRLKGEMSCAEKYMSKPSLLVKLLADGLKMLWDVDISDCPRLDSPDSLNNSLRLAQFRVENNLCDTENVQPGTYGESGFENPAALLEWLKKNRPKEDLVFSHGDYCLPNIFLSGSVISGFIDLGCCGIADRYHDIALCYRSLSNNFSGRYGGKAYENFNADILFDALNIEPDWKKIRYYILLDELF